MQTNYKSKAWLKYYLKQKILNAVVRNTNSAA